MRAHPSRVRGVEPLYQAASHVPGLIGEAVLFALIDKLLQRNVWLVLEAGFFQGTLDLAEKSSGAAARDRDRQSSNRSPVLTAVPARFLEQVRRKSAESARE